MLSVAVIGANGYVGSAVCAALEKRSGIALSRVTRASYESLRRESYDVLINSAMPSKRFWAKNNPEKDFAETVQKTDGLLKDWKYKKFMHISTVSARCETATVYGRHKAEAERLCLGGENLIVRLTALYDEGLSKGALIDILEGRKVFVSGQSRYAFTPLEFAGEWIAGHLGERGIIEVGAKNTVSLQEIADHLGEKVEFEGPVQTQEVLNPRPEFPDARDVFAFMDRMKKHRKAAR